MLTSFAQCLTSQAAHVTHVTTADLLKLHKLQDPVDKIRRMKGRITKLRKRSRAVADAAADVALHSHILIDLDRILQEAQALPVATQATLAPAHHCHICQAAFDTEHGLRMHTSKMHRDSLSRLLLENGLQASLALIWCSLFSRRPSASLSCFARHVAASAELFR